MIRPTLAQFKQLAAEALSAAAAVPQGDGGQPGPNVAPWEGGAVAVVPLVCRLALDTETPITIFHKLVGSGPGYLLESLTGGEPVGRYSFIGAAPRRRLFRHEGVTTVQREGGSVETNADPFTALREFMAAYHLVAPPEVELPRFPGGAVGYFSYDAVRHITPLAAPPPDDLALPEACFLDCQVIAAVDHSRHHLTLLVPLYLPAGADAEQVYRTGTDRLQKALTALKQPRPLPPMALDATCDPIAFHSAVDQGQFQAMAQSAREKVLAGQASQVVVSRRLETALPIADFQMYRAMRVTSPSPYMFFFRPGDPADFALIGASPETLVRVKEGRAIVRPLAGTRPRGADEKEDLQLADDLLADPKERAEHAMLVELGRQDLAQVCRPDSVTVDTYMEVERHSHVMHLVSNVSGRLQPGKDAVDALKAAFPAGTLSGAPRRQALQIIDQLEPVGRGPYGGTFGYLAYGGNLDTCIIIRTLVKANGRIFLQTGAGIVADSDVAAEFVETENKARAALAALALAQGQSEEGRL